MAAQATVTLTDAAGTPVNRAFLARGFRERDGKPWALWQYVVGGVIAGYNQLWQYVRPPSRNSDAYKVTYVLDVPILEQTSPSTATGIQPAPTVAYHLLATVEFVLPVRCSEQERKDLQNMTKDLLGEAVLTDSVWSLDPVY